MIPARRPFNRTSMELKPGRLICMTDRFFTFNRTSMELKHGRLIRFIDDTIDF